MYATVTLQEGIIVVHLRPKCGEINIFFNQDGLTTCKDRPYIETGLKPQCVKIQRAQDLIGHLKNDVWLQTSTPN